MPRSVLLASVAVAALALAAPDRAMAGCVVPPPPATTVTCTGDVTAGVQLVFPPAISTITVRNATTGIAPANTNGLAIRDYRRDLTVINDLTNPSGTGTFAIHVTGAGNSGILLNSHENYYGGHGVTVTNTGTIQSDGGSAIAATGDTSVSVTSHGELQAAIAGIDAWSRERGAVTVRNYGNISGVVGTALYGIRARANLLYAGASAALQVINRGDISVGYTGIGASAGDNGFTVDSVGNISSTSGVGISAGGARTSAVTSTGDITTGSDGILAIGGGGMTMTVTSTGNIVSTTGVGIYAHGGRAIINNNKDNGTGFVSAGGTGLYGRGFTSVIIDNTGNITSTNGAGIVANTITPDITGTSGNDVLVTTRGGNITAKGTGIAAISQSENKVEIVSTSDIVSSGGSGIVARRFISTAVDSVNVSSGGSISAAKDGIYAFSNGAVTATNTGAITAGTTGINARGGSSSGLVTVNNYATINAGGSGIFTRSNAGGATVLSTAKITAGAQGIITADLLGGPLKIDNRSDVVAGQAGVLVTGSGAVTVSNTGAIASTLARGIDISTDGSGPLDVVNGAAGATGSITSRLAGISAVTLGSGSVSVKNHGSIDAGIGATGTPSRFAYGILASSQSGDVTVDNSGSVTSRTAAAISALASGTGRAVVTNSIDGVVDGGMSATAEDGSVSITNSGTLIGRGSIRAFSETGGIDISVEKTGEIYSEAAIYARSAQGDINMRTSGRIATSFYSIRASSSQSDLSLFNDGDITSDTGAISVGSGGVTTVENTGKISSGRGGSGISAGAREDVTVTSSGIVISGNKGISVGAYDGDAAVIVRNASANFAVDAESDGIEARSNYGNATVEIIGNVRSSQATAVAVFNWYDGSGVAKITTSGRIVAGNNGLATYTYRGAANVHNTGDITAGYSAIHSYSFGDGGVEVSSAGTLAAGRLGIGAQSHRGAVTVGSTGNITAGDMAGIRAVSYGSSAVAVTSVGDIRLRNDRTYGYDYYGNLYLTSGVLAASSGGAVSVQSTGNITTDHNAAGIEATSTGDGAVSVTSRGDVHAAAGDLGPSSHGIAAETDSGALSIDSRGSVTSDSAVGIAALSQTGSVTVTGGGAVTGHAQAIHARSAAGGDVTVNFAGSASSATAEAISAAATGGGTVTVTAGAAGSAGQIAAKLAGVMAVAAGAGNVSVSNFDAVHAGLGATGDAALLAHAIVAVSQSGTVTVNNAGSLASDGADGIFARSEGKIDVSSSGAITAREAGIVAGSTAGPVTVGSTGTIAAGSFGIVAMSEAGTVAVTAGGSVASESQSAIVVAGGGNLNVSLEGIASGAVGKAGVEFGVAGAGLDGGANALSIESAGRLGNAGGIAQLAVLGRSGNETVTNAGTLTGNVDLGGGTNSIFNAKGGLFEMGPAISIGSGNSLTNAGTMSPGLRGSIARVNVTGDVVQTADGVWDVDIDGDTGAADLMLVSGKADLAGAVAVTALTRPKPKQEFLIMQADGGVTDAGLALRNTVALQLKLIYRSSATPVAPGVAAAAAAEAGFIDQVWLGASADFVVKDLDPNQTKIAINLNKLILDPGGVTPVIDALIGIPEIGPYKVALDELLPDPYLHTEMATVLGADQFSDMLISCKVRNGAYAFIAEGQCAWLDTGGSDMRRDATRQGPAAEYQDWWLAGGTQVAISDTLRLGFGARYDQASQDMTSANTDGQSGSIGAALTYNSGPLLLGTAVTAGKGWFDTERQMSFNGFNGKASGSQTVGYVHGKMRAAYLADFGAWYVKPRADVAATWVSSAGISEDGGAGAALDINQQDHTVLQASPALEIGGEWTLQDGITLRPYASAGATLYGNTGFGMTARFADAPPGAPDFETQLSMDDVLATVTAGLDVLTPNGTDLRFYYEGSFGQTTTMNAAGLRAAVSF